MDTEKLLCIPVTQLDLAVNKSRALVLEKFTAVKSDNRGTE